MRKRECMQFVFWNASLMVCETVYSDLYVAYLEVGVWRRGRKTGNDVTFDAATKLTKS